MGYKILLKIYLEVIQRIWPSIVVQLCWFLIVGDSSDDVSVPTDLLKADNTAIIAIGIGRINETLVNSIASAPNEYFAFKIPSYSALNRIADPLAHRIRRCEVIIYLDLSNKVFYM